MSSNTPDILAKIYRQEVSEGRLRLNIAISTIFNNELIPSQKVIAKIGNHEEKVKTDKSGSGIFDLEFENIRNDTRVMLHLFIEDAPGEITKIEVTDDDFLSDIENKNSGELKIIKDDCISRINRIEDNHCKATERIKSDYSKKIKRTKDEYTEEIEELKRQVLLLKKLKKIAKLEKLLKNNNKQASDLPREKIPELSSTDDESAVEREILKSDLPIIVFIGGVFWFKGSLGKAQKIVEEVAWKFRDKVKFVSIISSGRHADKIEKMVHGNHVYTGGIFTFDYGRFKNGYTDDDITKDGISKKKLIDICEDIYKEHVWQKMLKIKRASISKSLVQLLGRRINNGEIINEFYDGNFSIDKENQYNFKMSTKKGQWLQYRIERNVVYRVLDDNPKGMRTFRFGCPFRKSNTFTFDRKKEEVKIKSHLQNQETFFKQKGNQKFDKQN